MKLTEQMLAATEQIWDEYHRHPFVTGIADGTLDKEKFRHYIVQDYLYLVDYAKIFALGIAKATSPATARLFAGYIQQLTGEEMDIHRGYLGELAVTAQELAAARPALANLSYTSYMLRVAYEGGEAQALTAILACAYSYEVIAKNILAHYPQAVAHPFYGAWVQGYASEEYAAENAALLNALNDMTADYTPAQTAPLVDIFVACSRYELGFWDMAWQGSH